MSASCVELYECGIELLLYKTVLYRIYLYHKESAAFADVCIVCLMSSIVYLLSRIFSTVYSSSGSASLPASELLDGIVYSFKAV